MLASLPTETLRNALAYLARRIAEVEEMPKEEQQYHPLPLLTMQNEYRVILDEIRFRECVDFQKVMRLRGLSFEASAL